MPLNRRRAYLGDVEAANIGDRTCVTESVWLYLNGISFKAEPPVGSVAGVIAHGRPENGPGPTDKMRVREGITEGMSVDIQKIKDQVLQYSDQIERVKTEVRKALIGQDHMLSRLLIALLTGGHVLLEGVPGLAKTTAIKALAAAIHCKFNRIQFTPDLLPADLIGTLIYNPREGAFSTRKGPIFANLILADEINRAAVQGPIGAARSDAGTSGYHWRRYVRSR